MGGQRRKSFSLEERSLAMTDLDLVRFVNAQTSVYGQVVEELSERRKRTHWMWCVFRNCGLRPQSTRAGTTLPAFAGTSLNKKAPLRHVVCALFVDREDIRLENRCSRDRKKILQALLPRDPLGADSEHVEDALMYFMRAQIPGPCSF